MNSKDLERFLSYVYIPVDEAGEPLENSCWPWTGSVEREYGYIRIGNKKKRSHRVIWEHCFGELLDEIVIHHTCHRKLCVNPGHLKPVTLLEHGNSHRKTHCYRGHKFTEENTYYVDEASGTKGRRCRKCRTINYIGDKSLERVAQMDEEQLIRTMEVLSNKRRN
jgi:hypothetical protein